MPIDTLHCGKPWISCGAVERIDDPAVPASCPVVPDLGDEAVSGSLRAISMITPAARSTR
jgi:hypothetical protein